MPYPAVFFQFYCIKILNICEFWCIPLSQWFFKGSSEGNGKTHRLLGPTHRTELSESAVGFENLHFCNFPGSYAKPLRIRLWGPPSIFKLHLGFWIYTFPWFSFKDLITPFHYWYELKYQFWDLKKQNIDFLVVDVTNIYYYLTSKGVLDKKDSHDHNHYY